MALLLLHGALGSARQLADLQRRIGGIAIDLSGHGDRGIPSEGIRFEQFVGDIDRSFEEQQWVRADLFGYSMGGYAAMLYAAQRPERVRSVVTLGTKYLWTEEGLQRELRMLDPEVMERKVPVFAQALAEAHGKARWKSVVRAIARSMTELARMPLLTPEVCSRIQCPALICVGEDDATAVPDDTRLFARRVKGAEVLVLPNTPHPLSKVDLDFFVPRVMEFWEATR